LEIRLKDYRHVPMSQMMMPLATSMESLNSSSSRRTSLLNPVTTVEFATCKTKPKESSPIVNSEVAETVNPPEDTEPTSPTPSVENEDVVKTEEENGNDSKELVESPIDAELLNGDLDPLGVIEEQIRERSRRNSPVPEEMLESMEKTEEPVETPVQPPVEKSKPSSNSLTVPGMRSNKCNSDNGIEGIESDPIIVPYLCPLVLRKELENVLEHEGDSCLVQSRFVDEHPIIYWNLVYFFHRAYLTSHLRGLCLHAKSVIPTHKKVVDPNGEITEEEFKIHDSWETVDHRNVFIKCKWDNPKFHEQFGQPLYLQYLGLKEEEKKDSESDNKSHDVNGASK